MLTNPLERRRLGVGDWIFATIENVRVSFWVICEIGGTSFVTREFVSFVTRDLNSESYSMIVGNRGMSKFMFFFWVVVLGSWAFGWGEGPL